MIHVGDCREMMGALPEASVAAIVTDPPYELDFMGKGWDRTGIAYDPLVWSEALRLLPPGGHLLAFGGTRTSHRMVSAIEDAGFEIRDSLVWLYGSGFPKSHDVGKAMDRAAGAEREVVGPSHWGPDRRPNAQRGALTIGGDLGAHPGTTLPATDAARQWDGWGTALKPGHEPIVLARKPLDGTVAQNVQQHRTGALNIDAARIGDEVIWQHGRLASENVAMSGANYPQSNREQSWAGRWPANVLLDPGAAARLDQQASHVGGSWGESSRGMRRVDDGYGFGQRGGALSYHDQGGASRFFYCAKASTGEREAGLIGHLPCGTCGQFTSETHIDPSGREVTCRRNLHPTVKPVDLIRWLVRLITPPRGTVLDPFLGSGTTGVACGAEGLEFVGIELEPDYARVAELRIARGYMEPVELPELESDEEDSSLQPQMF